MSSNNSPEDMQLVTFVLGDESFGLNIMNVQEVIRMPSITRFPQAPDYVDGITSLRGNILPVIDTRKKFGLDEAEINESNRVIVVNSGGTIAGLNVDSVSQVLRVDNKNIEAATRLADDSKTTSVTNVVKLDGGKKLIMVLDACSLLGQEAVNLNATGAIFADKDHLQSVIDEIQIVSFQVGDEEFGLEIAKVKEIIRVPDIVKVPNVPNYIKGIIFLRDTLMPIYDLRTKLGLNNDEIMDTARIVVVEATGMLVGLIVDRVFEVTRISRDTIFPPPQIVSHNTGELITGIVRLENGKRTIMLMDVMNIIDQSVMEQIHSAKDLVKETDNNAAHDLVEKQLVVFKLADEEFGVSIEQVQEINKIAQITKIPRTPQFVEGIVNLRGDVIPVIDLRKRLAMDIQSNTDRTRIVVSEINNKKIGLIVDEVLEVLRISAQYSEPVPDIVQADKTQGFMGGVINVNKRMIMVLDLNNLLYADEIKQLGKLDATGKRPAKSKKG
ncbi:MAG: chemotaxis protein CheW [Syntrophomonadaceae bacterium]